MRNFSFALLLTTCSLFSLHCQKDAPAPAGSLAPASSTTPKAAAPGATPHAAAGAKPGSHEDWCGEHGVAESQCTRCNPSLIAAFKATGDWCAEHGLPESQCLLCNPNLKIERPPQTAKQ
jgi:hypothetical protein